MTSIRHLQSHVHGVADSRSRGHSDKTEFMERVGFGIGFEGCDYERRCVSREFLAHNSKETVFLFVKLHSVSLPFSAGRTEGSIGAL